MKKMRLSAIIARERLLRRMILGIALVFIVVGPTLSSSIVFAQTGGIEVPRSPYYPQSNEGWWLYQFDGYAVDPSHPASSNYNCGPACAAMVINYLKGKGITTTYHSLISNNAPDVHCYARWLYCKANGHLEGFENTDWTYELNPPLPGATTPQILYALSVEGIQSHTLTGYACENDGTGIANIQNAIDQGKVCICLVAPMYYREGLDYFSHRTTVYGYDDNYIYLNDPGYQSPPSGQVIEPAKPISQMPFG